MNKALSKYLNLYREDPGKLAALMAADPITMMGAQKAFALTGAEDTSGGYHMRQDAIQTIGGTATTTDGFSINEIWNDLQRRLGVFNQQASLYVSLLSSPVEAATEKVAVYTTAKFEEATELGRPQKIRFQYISRGFPLKHYDLGYGYTQEYLDDARADQIAQIAGMVESAWWDTQFRVVMLALFTDTNSVDEDGVTVRRLYNADGEVPPEYKRWTHDGTHTHYLTSGGGGFDLTDIQAAEEHLLHHGFGDFGETIVLLANRSEMPTLRGLTGFIPATTGNTPQVVNGDIIGNVPSLTIPQLQSKVQGYIGQVVIVEENSMPDSYFLMFATGGLFGQQNVVGTRDHDNPSINGLRLVEGPVARYPLIDAVYDGYFGAGVKQRGAAVIMQDTAGAYAVPTF